MEEMKTISAEELENIVGGADMEGKKIRYYCTNCNFERIFDDIKDFFEFLHAHGFHHCVNCNQLGTVRTES
ncbi:MAG: bacteriocin [Ruminococcus sp.]|jgi:bacteriocin-like protein|nr:bacteriocin [Ruminococcus sp.]